MTNIRPLTPALAKKAKEELNEDQDRIQENIEHLRNWILKQPHLRARTTDQFLLAFLRCCKHSIERSKEKLDKLYALKASIPEILQNRDIDNPKVREIIRLGAGLILPLTNGDDGCRIGMMRPGAYDADKYTLPEVIKVGTMMADVVLLEDDNAMVAGQIVILDFANITAQHYFQFDPVFIKKFVVFFELAAPHRQKAIHIINTPLFFDTLINTVRSFMSEKNRQVLFVHGSNMESLYKHIPQKLLPAEYGGTNSTIQEIVDYWEKKLLEYRDYFKEEYKLGTDEKLRIGEPINPENIFGIKGSFRSLDVD